MTQLRKFAFETEFAPDGAILRDAAKKITSEEIEAQSHAAYQQGKHDARRAGRARSRGRAASPRRRLLRDPDAGLTPKAAPCAMKRRASP